MKHPLVRFVRVLRPLVLSALAFAPPLGAQATYYVDASAFGPGDGSAASPFPTIQAGVDAAAHLDVVSVAPGEYVENVVIPAQTAILVESQGGPTVTSLRAADAGAALRCETFIEVDANLPGIVGFTITDSDVGVSDKGAVLVERCIVTENARGFQGNGPQVRHCTVVGNDIGVYDGGYGVIAFDSIFWGNAAWDYYNPNISSFGVFIDCVGLQKTGGSGAGYSTANVLVADPLLWAPGLGEMHLQPGSPCIDFAGPDDAGALEHDPAYGADFEDLGFGLAGSSASTLTASGYLFPGQPVELSLAGGPPSGAAIVVLGSSAAFAPLFGGTLVPAPDAVLAPLPLDGAGELALPPIVWPALLPSGTAFFAQAWMPDPGAPSGWAASNGLQATTP